MGISIPPIHPTKQTLRLDPPPVKGHPNKKCSPAPQLPHGFLPPPSSKGKRSSHACDATKIDALSQKVDSHVLHSMLTAMLTDKTLQYEKLLGTAFPLASTMQTELEEPIDYPPEEDDIVNNVDVEQGILDPFDNPFANDFFDAPETVNTDTVFQHETDTTEFADRFAGAFSHAEKLSIRLLGILRRIGAPGYVYGEIMDIMDDALHHKVALTSTFRDHSLAQTIWRNGFIWHHSIPSLILLAALMDESSLW